MKDILRQILFLSAFLGWGLIVFFQCLSLSSIDTSHFVFLNLLFIFGAFIVFIPTLVILVRKISKDGYDFFNWELLDYFKKHFTTIPIWLSVVFFVSTVYSTFTFGIWFLGEGYPDIIGGDYVLHNKGDILKKLTQQQYLYYRAAEFRADSATLLFFYSFSMLFLYPFKKQKTS